MQKAQKTQTSPFDANNWRVGIVVAQFNSHITNRSLESVLKRAKSYGITDENIQIVEVAGCIEIPLALQKLAHGGRYKALVAIGCVIRGETAHFDYVCRFVTDGVLRVQLDQGIPIAFGVLTCDSEQQALARTNLAGEHLDAVLHLARSLELLEKQK